MSKAKVKYPRRLTFLRIGGCDVCNIVPGKDPFIESIGPIEMKMGWQYCENCRDTVKEWKNLCTLSKEILEQEFGDTLYVIRSNGKKEYGWQIRSPGYRLSSMENWYIDLCHTTKNIYKSVSLNDLRKWN